MSSTRSKSIKNKTPTTSVKTTSDRKIFFIEDDLLTDKSSPTNVISIKNPISGDPAFYFCTKDTIAEIISFAEPYRSWFLHQTVCANGKIYITTPIDPLFLILPYVETACVARAIPLDQIFLDEENSNAIRILDYLKEEQVALIGDCIKFGDSFAFKYNEKKAIRWLERKCQILEKTLKELKINVGYSATSATFISVDKTETTTSSTEYLRYAFELVSEYLSDSLSETLEQRLNVVEDKSLSVMKRKSITNLKSKTTKKSKVEERFEISKNLIDEDEDDDDELNSSLKRKSLTELQPKTIKRMNVEDSFEISKPRQPITPVVEKKPTAKVKAFAKAASHTKSISSFFKKA